MTTQKIDVLAVMVRLTDLSLNSGGRRGEDETDNEPAIKLYEDARRARDAVAELIESSRKVQEQVAPLLEKNGYIHVGAMDKHRRAVARIGGAE